jgi:hypothetical protein
MSPAGLPYGHYRPRLIARQGVQFGHGRAAPARTSRTVVALRSGSPREGLGPVTNALLVDLADVVQAVSDFDTDYN